jgi:hypothetical protein
MDNISNSILQSSEASSVSSFSTISSDSESFTEKIKNLSMTTWLIIIVILAFLGLNIFAYLAKGTDAVTSVFKPVVDTTLATFAYITGQTISTAAEGGKAVVGVAAGTAKTALDVVQDVATPQGSLKPNSFADEEPDIMKSNALNQALNTKKKSAQQTMNDYEADDALSQIQGRNKSGWCYIGEDRGFRSCVEVGPNDTCMSGDIFPTQEVCVNPRLRP